MTVPTTIDATAFLGKHLEGDGDVDLLRSMFATFAEALMSAEASMQCNARYGERTGGAGELPQRLPPPRLGHEGRYDRSRHPEAAPGRPIARVPLVAAPMRQAGPRGRDLPGLCGRSLDETRRRPREGGGDGRHLEVGGLPPRRWLRIPGSRRRGGRGRARPPRAWGARGTRRTWRSRPCPRPTSSSRCSRPPGWPEGEVHHPGVQDVAPQAWAPRVGFAGPDQHRVAASRRPPPPPSSPRSSHPRAIGCGRRLR